jgi:uncharacterized protein
MPVTPTYPGVYIEEVPSGVHTIVGVATGVTAFLGRAQRGPLNDPITIQSFADFDRRFGGLWQPSTMSYAVQQYFLNGGGEALVVRLDNGATLSTASLSAGADTLDLVSADAGSWGGNLRVSVDHDTESGDPDHFNLVVEETRPLPPPASWNTVEEPRDDFDDLGLTRDENAALYFPRVRFADPLAENRLAEFVPSAAVAGAMARTDVARGVWKAPAGQDVNLRGVRELTVSLTDGEQGQLNPLGINVIRSLPVVGTVIWGARTLRGADRLASEWKYVPVRRLALFLEESLYRGTQWAVFEPNDEPLWSQIRLNLGAFMHSLFRQGAFQGASPRDAYFVKCDKETTTQNDIDRGIVNIVVGFAPLKPAEFVIIKIEQIAGQIQT